MNRIPALKRFQIIVYKNKNGTTDKSQVPVGATEANVTIYRQGATANLAFDTVISPDTGENLPVFHTGGIVASPGDRLMVDWQHPEQYLVVESIDIATRVIHVFNETGDSITCYRHSRLTPLDPLARVFFDPMGTVPLNQPLWPSTDGTGLIAAYVADYRFDYLVSVPGDPNPLRGFIDAEGSFVMRG